MVKKYIYMSSVKHIYIFMCVLCVCVCIYIIFYIYIFFIYIMEVNGNQNLFMFHRRQKVTQVWNNMRASNQSLFFFLGELSL